MYLLVLDYGYEGYSTKEYDTIGEAIEASEKSNGYMHSLYEIARELTMADINDYRNSLEEKKAAAIEKAKSKLTAEELELLGLK